MVSKLRVLFMVSAVVLAAGASSVALAQDALSPDLRARVERLKADAAASPADLENARERARVLWEWTNAFALAGGHITPNMPAVLSRIMNMPEDRPVPLPSLLALDAYVFELGLHDENPNAVGTLTTDVSGPFRAASWQTIEVTYTVGEMPMAVGGGILVGRQFMSDQGYLQRENAAGDDYISIRSSNAGARFANDTAPLQGMHGGFRGAAPRMMFRLEGVPLEKGDTVTLTYGDRSGGSKGFRMQTFSNDACPLPLYIDLAANNVFLSLPIPTYEVVGTDVHAVHAFAPSIIEPGEPFDVSVRSEDLYYNRATGAIPEYEVLLDGNRLRTIPAGSDAITILSGLTISESGAHQFTLRSADGAVTGSSNPVWVEKDPDWRIYWGETHGHSGFAEGQGSVDGYFRFGRDDARLDFLTLSEHDIWLDDFEWQTMKDAVAKYTVEGQFIVFAGYEWTARRQQGGHHNVFFRTPAGRKRVPVHNAPYLSQLYHGLFAENDVEDVLIIPHAHQAGDWRQNDPGLERLVEIMSMHGTFEFFGRRYLEQGHQVGFVAASDDHIGHPGYTTTLASGLAQRGGLAGVLARSKTTDAIFSGLRARRTYATSGARMILDVALNGEAPGTRQAYTKNRVLAGRAVGSSAINNIAVIKNGEEVWSQTYALAPLKKHCWVQIGFESDSAVYQRDNPRGYRPWRGTLDVKGARIAGVEAPGFQNRYSESLARDADDPNRINFSTATRGRMNSILLELENAGAGTTITLDLMQDRERPPSPVAIRRPARVPAAQATFKLGDLAEGPVEEAFRIGRYNDRMVVSLVDPEAAITQEFEYTDEGEVAIGDYYYVRVRQLDGGLAWSSPFWVGGEPRR